jgi:holo-[acyl-carrier protein] synthase
VIVGIGSDVASISRIGEVLDRHGERFVKRVLTPDERARFARTVHKAAWLAKRWAAKEAFSKAIGTGIHYPFTWQSITIGRDPRGKPLVVPGEAMKRHLDSLGVARAHVTLTDDADVAFAVVVLESA